MMNETELKEKLQKLAQNGFRFAENEDLSEIIPEMLNHIGSTDSYLRDDLIYSAFGTWILRYDVIDHEKLREMLPIILGDQHLLYRIGEQNTDSVFRRSFSALLLPLLLISHRSKPFFTPAEIYQIKEKLLYFLKNEKDHRGYIPEKGWAHAVAHAADALDDLAQCTELNNNDLAEILDVIRSAICIQDTGYIHLEDERNITAVIAILKRQVLTEKEIIRWIESFADQTLLINAMPEKLVIRANVKNFLQSLYFRLQWELGKNEYETPINQTLHKINLFSKPEDG
ncbi:MAG: hypothetical protein CVU39_08735 [Chloroflexi bacterium HGW-Chloroflexi-10]|nr:MAG: hypothetical protein CVU39_08735 [Chloroflexi bacterium HGW-Chloroflexi-10]